jgi:magnesium-transporting ATPase (P-type)
MFAHTGDLTPETNEQRVFTIFMLLVGLVAVFSTINDFATYIIEAAEKKALAQLDTDESPHSSARYAWRILLSLLSILTCLAVGTVFFIFNEDWNFIEALYFSVVTTVSGIVHVRV